MAMILAYLLHPLANFISRRTGLSWRTAVNLIYLLLLVVVISLITATGVAAVQQTQNLFRVVDGFIANLPELVEALSQQVFMIGPYQIDMQALLSQYDIDRVINQVISFVQPALGQAGGLIGSIASGTFSTLGWIFFILLVSYFSLADAGHFPDMFSGMVSSIDLPGYREDFAKLGKSLARIWNAFIRGQLFLFVTTVGVVFVLLSILGVRNALALALVAGLARFSPISAR
jgi:predicted PurR-regulated permease PerM